MPLLAVLAIGAFAFVVWRKGSRHRQYLGVAMGYPAKQPPVHMPFSPPDFGSIMVSTPGFGPSVGDTQSLLPPAYVMSSALQEERGGDSRPGLVRGGTGGGLVGGRSEGEEQRLMQA